MAVFDGGIFDSGIFDAESGGNFTASAVIFRTNVFSGNTWVEPGWVDGWYNAGGGITLGAVISAGGSTVSDDFAADAVVLATASGSFSASAVIKKTVVVGGWENPTYVQHKSADGTGASQSVTLDTAPTAGNVQILWATRRESAGATFTPDGTGWSLIQRTSCSTGDNWPVEMHYRVVPSGASATINCTGASDLIVAEFSGVGNFDISAYSGAATSAATVSITPAGSSDVLLIAGVSIRSDWGVTLTPATGMTGIVTGSFSGSGPYSAFAYQTVTGTSGSYTVGFTGNSGVERAVVGASFLAGSTAGATLDAVITAATTTVPGDFSADAVIAATIADSFSTDAIIAKEQSGSLTLDAVIALEFTTVPGSLTADALALAVFGSTFVADAVVYGGTVSDSFTADAVIKRSYGNYDEEILALNPLVYYRFNETTGTFADIGSSARPATPTGAVVRGVDGIIDTGFTLSGSAQYATTASYTLTLANVFTIEVWCYPTGTGRRTIWGVNNASGQFQLELGGAGTDRIAAIINGTYVAETTNLAYTRNQWNHIVYRRTGTGAGTHAFWVNGVAQTIQTNAATNFTDAASVKYIGARTSSSQLFIGTLDELAIFGTALDEAVIRGHAASYGLRFTGNAWVRGTLYGSFTANAIISASASGSFTADAGISNAVIVGADFTADATLFGEQSGSFTAAAVFLITSQRTFTADALQRIIVVGDFAADAELVGGFTVDAAIAITEGDAFYVLAHIVGTPIGSFTAAAVIFGSRSGSGTLNAITHIGRSASLMVDAWIQTDSGTYTWGGSFTGDASLLLGTSVSSFSSSACLRRGSTGTLWANAVLYKVPTIVYGSFLIDAWTIGTVASFVANAQISSPFPIAGSFTAAASVSQEYRINSLTMDAIVTDVVSDAFYAQAEIGWCFTANAWLVGTSFSITADATVLTVPAHTFTADAVTGYPTVFDNFTADAWIIGTRAAFTADASIFDGHLSSSFTVDATFSVLSFVLDAFVQPCFTADAFFSEEPELIFDEDGNPLPRQPTQKRVEIILRKSGVNTDITEHVVFAESSFAQHARTAPGQFICVLRGSFTQWDGGEDIYVNVNGVRQFGGLVLQVTFGYWFDDKAEPKTTLTGTDYNIYLDRLILWNKATSEPYYKPPPTYAKNASDRHIIVDACRDLVNRPSGFDTSTYVDVVDADLNEDERWMVNTGQTLRLFLTEISKLTNAVWWIDQYLDLHYHDRGAVTAPYAITDGAGGVSCQNLSYTSDASSMLNDILVYGTLAATTEGEIYLSRRQNEDAIARYGLRQYSEIRSDLHTQKHVNKRANSIRSRRSIPIVTAEMDIFESGFFAGQVANLKLSTYDIAKTLVIRESTLTFPLVEGAIDGKFYATPKYSLKLGLEPDDPWNIYDMLPWDMPDWGPFPTFDGGDLNPCDDGGDDGGGGDCYNPGDCTSVIDGFSNRTVSPTNVGSNIWGQTPDGYSWMNSSLIDAPSGSVMMVETDNGIPVGRIALRSTVSASTGVIVSLNQEGSSYWPPPPDGNGLPTVLMTNSTVTYLIDFKINDVPKSYLEFGFSEGPANAGDAGVIWWVSGWNGTIGLDTYDSLYVTTSFSVTNQTWYTGKVSVVGGTAMLKVWQQGTPEPADWMLTRPTGSLPWTPGEFAIYADRDRGDNLSSNFYIANFRMEDPECLGPTDTFTRTVADGWGTSDAGETWEFWPDNGDTRTEDASVADGSGIVTVQPEIDGFGAGVTLILADSASANWGTMDLDATVTMTVTTIDMATNNIPWFDFEMGTLVFAYEGGMTGDGLMLMAGRPNGPPFYYTTTTPWTWITGVPYKIRMYNEFNVVAKCKVWLASTPEPEAWTLELTCSPQRAPSGDPYGFLLYAQSGADDYPTRRNQGLSLSIDSIDISNMPGGQAETGPGGLPWCDCNDPSCGITDTFDRADSTSMGTADCGIPWVEYLYGGSISENRGVIHNNGYCYLDVYSLGLRSTTISLTAQVSGSTDWTEFAVMLRSPDVGGTVSNPGWLAVCSIKGDTVTGHTLQAQLYYASNWVLGYSDDFTDIDVTQPFDIEVVWSQGVGVYSVKIVATQGSASHEAIAGYNIGSSPWLTANISWVRFGNASYEAEGRDIYIDNLEIVGAGGYLVNACTVSGDCPGGTSGTGGTGGTSLDDCFDLTEGDEPIWGWYSEAVEVDTAGQVRSRMQPVRGNFAIWYNGERLRVERDWTAVGTQTFQLSGDFLNQNSPKYVTLTYLINSQGIPIAWEPSRTISRTDVRVDGKYPLGVRGID